MKQKPLNEIIQNIINNIHDTLPEIDTKEGTFIRDVFVDPISDEIASIYADMKLFELSQSVLTATNNDLDKLAGNYFIYRKSATPSYGKVRFYIKNTDKSVIEDSDLPSELAIPEGTIVATLGTYTEEEIKFQTTESVLLTRSQIRELENDGNQGSYKYIEIAAKSTGSGSNTNIAPGEIVQQITNVDSAIAMVNNPFSFSGGTDYEDDNSLAVRINLAISGSNIGTKDGYLSYILKQNGVVDAKVIGAGESLMLRDGSYIDESGTYVTGNGGMVDIYIRGQLDEESEEVISISDIYDDLTVEYKDIILKNQPINSIISIELSNNVRLINALDYEIEKRNVEDGNYYYNDYEWDFSIVDNFPSFVVVPDNIKNDPELIRTLKIEMDNELKSALVYMTNLNYSLNWSLVNPRDILDSTGYTNLFTKMFFNNRVYKIETRNSMISLTFVKKDDTMYARIYLGENNQPDFKLVKDESQTGNSIKAKDRIIWLNTNKLSPDESLTVMYNYDQLISDLQDGIEVKRVLTADVLIKKATKIPVEIIVEATIDSNYDSTLLKNNITNRIVTYVDNIKKMGGSFDRSDIIALARQTEGVTSVNIDNISIGRLKEDPEKQIIAYDNEYLKVENIIVNIKFES